MTRPDGAPLRVLLAESHWAPEVSAPPWPALMAWLFDTVPFLVQRAVDAPMRRSSRALDGAHPLARIGFGARRLMQNVFAVTFSLTVLVLLFAIGLLSGLGPVRERLFGASSDSARAFPTWARLLAILTFVPIGLRLEHGTAGPLEILALLFAATIPTVVLLSLSERLRGLVVGFIGDSYALLHEDGSHHAIVDRVRGDLARLEADVAGAPVVIAAHSQGAEIARRVLRDRSLDAGPVAGLVTFGAGIAKLYAVDRLRGQSKRSWRAFCLRYVSALCTTGAVVALVAPVLIADGGPSVYTVAAAVAVAAALIALAALTLGRARGHLRASSASSSTLRRWGSTSASSRTGPTCTPRTTRSRRATCRSTRAPAATPPRSSTAARSRSTTSATGATGSGFLAAIALEIERVADEHAEPLRPPALTDAADARARTIGAVGPLRVATVALAGGLGFALTPGLPARSPSRWRQSASSWASRSPSTRSPRRASGRSCGHSRPPRRPSDASWSPRSPTARATRRARQTASRGFRRVRRFLRQLLGSTRCFSVVLQIGAPRFELGTSPTRTVRATRLRHAPMPDDYLTTTRQPPGSTGRRDP